MRISRFILAALIVFLAAGISPALDAEEFTDFETRLKGRNSRFIQEALVNQPKGCDPDIYTMDSVCLMTLFVDVYKKKAERFMEMRTGDEQIDQFTAEVADAYLEAARLTSLLIDVLEENDLRELNALNRIKELKSEKMDEFRSEINRLGRESSGKDKEYAFKITEADGTTSTKSLIVPDAISIIENTWK